MTITAFPLAWPPGWKRTAPDARGLRPLRYHEAIERRQLAVGAGHHRRRGHAAPPRRTGPDGRARRPPGAQHEPETAARRLAAQRSAQPADPGAAVYWNDPWSAAPRCMAIDRYTKVEMNIAALAATIEAMRAIERHGGAVVLERAFTGFAALPAPIVAGMKRHWRDVLQFGDGAPTRESITSRYRILASTTHPDRGGNTAAMAELNQARDDALKEVK